MSRLSARVSVFALLLSAVLAAAAWAGCASYISSQQTDAPLTGYLIGTETRSDSNSRTRTTNLGGQASAGGRYANASGSATHTSTTTTSSTRTYEVGTYQMSNGQRIQVDCSSYKQVQSA